MQGARASEDNHDCAPSEAPPRSNEVHRFCCRFHTRTPARATTNTHSNSDRSGHTILAGGGREEEGLARSLVEEEGLARFRSEMLGGEGEYRGGSRSGDSGRANGKSGLTLSPDDRSHFLSSSLPSLRKEPFVSAASPNAVGRWLPRPPSPPSFLPFLFVYSDASLAASPRASYIMIEEMMLSSSAAIMMVHINANE